MFHPFLTLGSNCSWQLSVVIRFQYLPSYLSDDLELAGSMEVVALLAEEEAKMAGDVTTRNVDALDTEKENSVRRG